MPNELYEVTDQRAGFILNPAGGSERSTVVVFRTKATGSNGEVEIAASDFTPQNVDAAIRALVPTIDAVAQL
jgi:hypothetical protein